MLRARKMGIRTPVVYLVEHEAHTIYMEFVEGRSVKDTVRSDELPAEQTSGLMVQIGEAVAKMHDGGLIHGDLTTSNLIVEATNGQLVWGPGPAQEPRHGTPAPPSAASRSIPQSALPSSFPPFFRVPAATNTPHSSSQPRV
mmetsp:Transcript_35898/g.85141  ORF Transcript_35898/g.85141 Transcript_35898/m.85141 type:complete len:142 (-) Transcript_35898:1160-1585(-)